MTVMDTRTWGTEKNDDLPHQIRLHQSDKAGGLGVYVTCVCMSRARPPLTIRQRMLGGRNITSNEDSWVLYNAHLVAPLTEQGHRGG